jgi:hypothetical protein
MKIKTVQSPSYNNQISELNRRISRLESILNGAPIADAKIASIKWNKAVGGTATLGGADNGNGVLEVKDNADETKVVVDKDGIVVNDGNLTLRNADGELIVSGSGLVGENVYKHATVSGSPDTTFTNTSWATQASSTMNFTTVQNNTRVLVMATLVAHGSGSLPFSDTLDFGISLDDVDPITPLYIELHPLGEYDSGTGETNTEFVNPSPMSIVGVIDVGTAGNHSLSLKRRVRNGNCNGVLNYFSIVYLLLGA